MIGIRSLPRKQSLRSADLAMCLKQQSILIRLLTDYTDRFYQNLKAGYEGQFYDVAEITADHGSMLKLYQIDIDDSDDGRSLSQAVGGTEGHRRRRRHWQGEQMARCEHGSDQLW